MALGGSSRYAKLRERMLTEQLEGRGIEDSAVLQAMRRVPREHFVPEALRSEAYEDRALPIGPDQSISQPFIVGLMLQELDLQPNDRVLEIGTGSGYQTALLAEIAGRVFTIELDLFLLEQARERLSELGYHSIEFRNSNGFEGWPEQAPFDKIIVSAAPDHIPRELVRELGVGGVMILPLGVEDQVLVSLSRDETGLKSAEHGGVRFVVMKN